MFENRMKLNDLKIKTIVFILRLFFEMFFWKGVSGKLVFVNFYGRIDYRL